MQTAAQRGVERELGLRLNAHRYRAVGAFSLIWPIRREAPVNNGCHHLLIAHQVELTENEKRILDRQYADDKRYIWLDIETPLGSDILPELADVLLKLQPISTAETAPALDYS